MTATEGEKATVEFGPGHPEWCPNAPEDDQGHCGHWWDCEPCHRCGDDTPDPSCDCPRCTYVRQADQGYPDEIFPPIEDRQEKST